MIQEFFNEKLNDEPNRPINPGEAVGYSAAVQGAILTGEGSSQCRKLQISQQVVTEADFEEALAKRRRWRTSAVEAEESWPEAPGASEAGMARRRVEVVAETAAEVETGRRSRGTRCSRSSRYRSQAEEEQPERPGNTN